MLDIKVETIYVNTLLYEKINTVDFSVITLQQIASPFYHKLSRPHLILGLNILVCCFENWTTFGQDMSCFAFVNQGQGIF